MIFTTVKRKTEKQEAFPDIPVLTQHVFKGDKGSKTSFSFNSKAMELLGFPLNTPNVSKVAHGFDENNNLVLATIDTKDIYTSNITAKKYI